MGLLDRIVRLLVAIVLVALFVANRVSGVLGIVLSLLALFLAVTSLFGICPLYLPFRLSTRASRSAPPPEVPPPSDEAE